MNSILMMTAIALSYGNKLESETLLADNAVKNTTRVFAALIKKGKFYVKLKLILKKNFIQRSVNIWRGF